MLNQSGGPGYGTAFLDQEAAMELYNTIISKISDILYYPLVVPLFLVFTGVYFTIRSRGIQIMERIKASQMMAEKEIPARMEYHLLRLSWYLPRPV